MQRLKERPAFAGRTVKSTYKCNDCGLVATDTYCPFKVAITTNCPRCGKKMEKVGQDMGTVTK